MHFQYELSSDRKSWIIFTFSLRPRYQLHELHFIDHYLVIYSMVDLVVAASVFALCMPDNSMYYVEQAHLYTVIYLVGRQQK